MLEIKPNKKNIGAELIVNLKEISNKDIFKIKRALNKYGMLYFKEQKLTSKLYIKFAKHFGKLANYPRLKGLSKKFKQITVVQRKVTDKGPSFGEQFHTDSIYTKKPPRFTMLYSKLVPKKGRANTEFSSQYLAYDYLIFLTPLDLNIIFKTIGILIPMVAIIIGFIPGCGPQILVTTLFINGMIPFSALLGNAISNDGDALFPAIAIAPRAAILATFYSAIPACIMAYTLYFFFPLFGQ